MSSTNLPLTDMIIKANPTWEARIYVGSREGYDGAVFDRSRVEAAIAGYQTTAPEQHRGCVRITPTRFQFDKYTEDGWEIGLMDYPRFPVGPENMKVFADNLARHLLVELKQNGVGLVMPHVTMMFRAADAVNL